MAASDRLYEFPLVPPGEQEKPIVDLWTRERRQQEERDRKAWEREQEKRWQEELARDREYLYRRSVGWSAR